MRNNICFVYLLLLIVLPVCSKNVSHFSIYEIMCEQQVEPLGIENKSPRFSWKVVSQQRAYRQSAYRILVTDIEGALAADEGTGIQESVFLQILFLFLFKVGSFILRLDIIGKSKFGMKQAKSPYGASRDRL